MRRIAQSNLWGLFESLYRTLMFFDNPNTEALECMKKLVELRKNDIFGNEEGIA